jgi:L-alanine-DL-glutamate epimerase-like enolase superfamily enzyme
MPGGRLGLLLWVIGSFAEPISAVVKMQIVDMRAEKMQFELVGPVVVSLGTVTHGETVIVKVSTDAGICGYGEGAGITFVTGETNDTVVATVGLLKKELIGLNPLSMEHIHRVMDRTLVSNASAKAAIDIALYDILGKKAKVPLYKLLGGVTNQVETDMTI